MRLIWLAVVLVGVIHFCHVEFSKRLTDEKFASAILLPAPQAAKLLTLGFDQIIADCYWLAFVNYVGDAQARLSDHYQEADDYLDLITTLDPNFVQPYWFAAFIVGSELRNPERAQEIIDRGVTANPDNWYLPYIGGVNLYLFAHNEIEAARYYRRASRYPDAPKWLARQADILEAKIPSQIKELNTWSNVYSTSDDGMVRDMAKAKLTEGWMQVFRRAPTDPIRQRARTALKELGIDVELSKP